MVLKRNSCAYKCVLCGSCEQMTFLCTNSNRVVFKTLNSTCRGIFFLRLLQKGLERMDTRFFFFLSNVNSPRNML